MCLINFVLIKVKKKYFYSYESMNFQFFTSTQYTFLRSNDFSSSHCKKIPSNLELMSVDKISNGENIHHPMKNQEEWLLNNQDLLAMGWMSWLS